MIRDIQIFLNDSRTLAKEFSESQRYVVNYLRYHYSTYLGEDDFNDVFQDAWIILYENVQKGKVKEITSVKSYLLSICINQINKKIERDPNVTKRDSFPTSYDPEQPGIDEGQIARILGTTEDECDKEECFSAIRSSVNSIGEKCKQILLSIYWDNLSHKDIAEMMEYSGARVVTTKSNRCRDLFREKNQHLLEICRK